MVSESSGSLCRPACLSGSKGPTTRCPRKSVDVFKNEHLLACIFTFAALMFSKNCLKAFKCSFGSMDEHRKSSIYLSMNPGSTSLVRACPKISRAAGEFMSP